MAVQGTETAPNSQNKAGYKRKGFGAWIKRNKLAAGGIAAGAGLILLTHKGKGGQSGESSELLKQEQEQAIENQRAAAEAGSIIPGSSVPARAGASEGSEDGGVSGGGSADTTGIGTPSAPENGTSSENPTVEKLTKDIEENTSAVEKEVHADQESGTTKAKGSKKPRAAKKHRTHPTKETHKTGVTVHGRHFPGATGHTKGGTHHSRGGTKTTHHISYGGKTETHDYNHTTKKWEDHSAAHTPPSRRANAPARKHPEPRKAAPKPAHHPAKHHPAKKKRK